MHLISVVVNLLKRMRSRIVELRAAGRLLLEESELADGMPGPLTDVERATIERSFGLAPLRLGIRRLPFGRLVVLDPAHLYAAVEAVRDHAGRLGGQCAVEDPCGLDPRLALAAMVRLVETERAVLVGQGGKLLLHCPTAVTAQRELELPAAARVEWSFDGDGETVFASLATRMCHAPVFTRVQSWHNGGLWNASTGGRCAVELIASGPRDKRLVLSFDKTAATGARPFFELYVQARLETLVDRSSVRRRTVFVCLECETVVSEEQVRKRRDRGLDWLVCNVCAARVPLREEAVGDGADASIAGQLERGAGIQRRKDIAALILRGKRLTADYDAFFAHAAADRDAVVRIAGWVEERGILPWLDRWEQRDIGDSAARVRAALIFVGRDLEVAWDDPRVERVLRQLVERKIPVIRVDLPGKRRDPSFPDWLHPVTTVDFSVADPNPVDELGHWISGWTRDTIV